MLDLVKCTCRLPQPDMPNGWEILMTPDPAPRSRLEIVSCKSKFSHYIIMYMNIIILCTLVRSC